MVFTLQSWDTIVWLLVLITEIWSVPRLVFEITLIACVIPAFSEGNSFFLGKTPLGIHCSIIAINVLSKVARFRQHSCQTKVYPVKKFYMVFENLPKNISKLIVDGM